MIMKRIGQITACWLMLMPLCGCELGQNDEGVQDAQAESSAANSEFDPFDDLAGRKTNPIAPQSEEAFIAAYRKAYEAGDREALLDLIFWDDIDPKFAKTHAASVIQGLGEAKILELKFEPYDKPEMKTFEIAGSVYAANLEPRRNISINRKAAATKLKPERTYGVRTPVGIHDGRYYFCGVKLVEETDSPQEDSQPEE